MKKIISLLSFTLGLLFTATAFVACGGDDDDNIISSPDSQDALKAKHITRVVFLTESDGVEKQSKEGIISYDSEGRVSSFIWKEGDEMSKYRYTYDESRIIEDSGSSNNRTFSLLNGRVTSAEDCSFSYDSSGHLQTKKGKREISFTWKNNNLVSYVRTNESLTRTANFEYSDIRVPVNYIPYLFFGLYKNKFSDNYPFLSYYGFFGKNSQNLAKKMVETRTGDSSLVTEEYDYTMKDGLPIEIAVKRTKISSNGEESINNNRILIEWN